MSKHTPGPWQTMPEECDKAYIRVRGTALGNRYKVANVLTPTYEGVHQSEAEETRRNAQLIAAAPELLDALRGAVVLFGCHCNDCTALDWLSRAEAALTKAGGELFNVQAHRTL